MNDESLTFENLLDALRRQISNQDLDPNNTLYLEAEVVRPRERGNTTLNFRYRFRVSAAGWVETKRVDEIPEEDKP